MKRKQLLSLLPFVLLAAGQLHGQPPPQRYERLIVGPVYSGQTMKPVVRGTQYDEPSSQHGSRTDPAFGRQRL